MLAGAGAGETSGAATLPAFGCSAPTSDRPDAPGRDATLYSAFGLAATMEAPTASRLPTTPGIGPLSTNGQS